MLTCSSNTDTYCPNLARVWSLLPELTCTSISIDMALCVAIKSSTLLHSHRMD